jgi:O-methyltransferase
MSIKRLIKSCINKIGYDICSTKTRETEHFKYCELIKEIYGLYGELLFTEILPFNEIRIRLMANLKGTGVSEALYLINYLSKSLKISGDICEFGVAQGATSALMANEIRETDKVFWLFDSFEGLPKPTRKDILKDDIFDLGSIDAYEGKMAFETYMVKEKLRAINFPFHRVKIIKGFIEETIKQPYLPDSICFAYVDFDFYQPILTALNFLDKVIQIGGVVIVDDYNWFSTGAKIAVDEFVSLNKEKYTLNFPIKPAGHFCIITKIS